MKATDRFHRSARRLILLASLLLGGSGLCLAQAPAKVMVADVVPEDNRLVPTQRIMTLIRTRPGTEYRQATVDDDVRRLYDTRSFSDIRIRLENLPDGRVTVHFKFVELPSVVQDIIYGGAKHLSKEDLESATGLRKGMPLNPVANQLARQAILGKYREQGRMFTSVELVEGGKPGDTRVVFQITEGHKVKISSIELTGVNFVSEARLHTQLVSSSSLFGLLGGDYSEEKIEQDLVKLEQYYKSYGFQDVFVRRELQWSEDARTVKVIYHVQEGTRYRIGSVQVEGAKSISKEQLEAYTRNARQGEFYNENVIKGGTETIKQAIGYGGVYAMVEPKLTHKDTGEVAVVYNVHEKGVARVGGIQIIGNGVTRDNVILRQIPLYPGQILTYPDLRRAEENLARLNIFEANGQTGVRPTLEVLDPESDSEFKTILVNVQETRTGSLLFGAGFNSDAGLTGSIVLNERNFDITRLPRSWDDFLAGNAFRGAGQEFRIEAIPGTELQRYTMSFREPFLFDSPYSLSVSAYYYDRIFNEYTEERVGTRISLGRRLNELWSVGGTVRVENVGVFNVPIFAPYTYQQAKGDNFLLGLRANVTRDSRDSYLRPTRGTLFEVGFEQCLGQYTFPLATVEGNAYWTIYQRPDNSGKHVLAARSQVSWAGANAPVYERFYAGGFQSMRGFEFRGVGPNINGFMTGGDFMFLNSLEYQIPVLANDQLYFVAFVDTGTVESKVNLDNYRVAAGVGARIVVPMFGPVPIALDFGFPIVKADTDRTQVFSFWLGFFH